MTQVKTVCVYCGSSMRVDQVYKDAAANLGKLIGDAGMRLVYGGGSMGLMGVVAQNALDNGSYVIGVIPKLLEDIEGAHESLSELHVVDSMHTRKLKMTEYADAFIILPGGFGTLDELFEVITWYQLKLHEKPIVVINLNGYWDSLKDLINNVVSTKFAKTEHGDFIKFIDTPDEVFSVLKKTPEPTHEFISEHV